MIHVGKFLDHSGCVLPDIFWKSKQFIKTVHYAPTYLVRYVKLRVTHAPRTPGTFSPPPRVSDPDIHHGTCVTHVAWCIPGSLTSGFLWSRWWENVPDIPSACATRIFTYLARDPWMCPSGAHLIITLNVYKDNDYISGIIFFSCIQTRTGGRFPHTNYEIQELNQIVVEGQLFLEWIIIHDGYSKMKYYRVCQRQYISHKYRNQAALNLLPTTGCQLTWCYNHQAISTQNTEYCLDIWPFCQIQRNGYLMKLN